MKRLFLILFIVSSYALNMHAQKSISYKVSEGKVYYKVEEVGKEPMYYRKKLVDGSVSMDFEKVSNGIFGEQYEEVKAEVKHVDGADQARVVEEMVKAQKAKESAQKAAKAQKEQEKELKEKKETIRKDKQSRGDKAKADAHLFVGGTAGVSYQNDALAAALEPMVGYQFNGRWAVGCGLGVQTYTDGGTEAMFIVNPFVRYNVWNNSRFYFDIKAEGTVGVNDNMTYYSFGFEPSFRMSINSHWQLSADFASLGFESYNGDNIKPVIWASAKGVVISAIYNF